VRHASIRKIREQAFSFIDRAHVLPYYSEYSLFATRRVVSGPSARVILIEKGLTGCSKRAPHARNMPMMVCEGTH
jgi:hypothetical protein